MEPLIGMIHLRAGECRKKLEEANLKDRWIPRLKSKIAEAVSECIIDLLGEDVVEAIYYIDLAGGEAVHSFEGRDVDIIVKVSEKVIGFEKDIKVSLEKSLNPILREVASWYVSMSGKEDLLEIHIVTDYSLGYGVLVRSRFSPAIRLWPKRVDERLVFGLL